MTKNILLQDLKWDYPFLPKGSNCGYLIDTNNKILIVERITIVGSFKIFETSLDELDYNLLEEK